MDLLYFDGLKFFWNFLFIILICNLFSNQNDGLWCVEKQGTKWIVIITDDEEI